MSAHGPAFPPAWLVNGLANIQTAAANWNRYQVRAVGRMIGGIIPGAFLASSLTDITDALPGSTDRTLDIAVAAVSAAALLILLRKVRPGPRHTLGPVGVVRVLGVVAKSGAERLHGLARCWNGRRPDRLD